MAKLNKPWHARSRMAANASLDQWIAWHLAHGGPAAAARCRAKIAGAIEAGSATEKTRRRRPRGG
jgi:plasmid stabilization system protein ParE